MNRPTEQPQSFSPFAQKPWMQGYSGISADQSMDGKTITVGPIPRANVEFKPFQNQNIPIAVGTHLTIVDGVITYIGPDAPPTTPPPTTVGPTTLAPTTVPPTTGIPTTAPPPTTPPPTTPTPPTTAPPTTPPP